MMLSSKQIVSFLIALLMSFFSIEARGAPSVTSWSPVGTATSSTQVTVTFNEGVDHSSVTSGSFTLSSAVGIKAIAAGGAYTVALKNDGTVVAWGDNSFGQTMVPTGMSGVTAIAAGRAHSVVLKDDGTVEAWGHNQFEQSTVPTGLTGVTAIAAGGYHTLVMKNDGTVVAWGANRDGQSAVPSGLSGVIAIAAGEFHSVALRNDGTLVAWGNDRDGQSTVPSGLTGVVAVAAGIRHTLALKNDGTVVAWGSNDAGQTSLPSDLSGVTAIAAGAHTVALKNDGTAVAWGGDSSSQTNVPSGMSGVLAIAAGAAHTVALKNDGTVVAWGNNDYGQISVPSDLTGVVAIAAGGAHTVALKSDGTAIGWGLNSSGQTTVQSGFSGFVAVAAGGAHTVALKREGTVAAWGSNDSGQITVPTALSGVTAIAAGNTHTVALKVDGTVVAWGNNSSGQTTAPSELSGVKAISAGQDHTVALKNDDTVVAWGRNDYGQSTVPTGLSGVTSIAAGGEHTVALKNDGTVVAWGRDDHGQSTVPSGLSGVTSIAAGGGHTVALKNDGTVVAWGRDDYGQSTVPSGLSWVTSIAAGGGHTLALRIDGTVVAWGNNNSGQSTVPVSPYETRVSGAVTYDPPSLTATFTPAAVLLFDTVYTARVNAGVCSRSGEHLPLDVVWNFTVDQQLPKNGTVGVVWDVTADQQSPINGSCGSNNGGIFTAAPTADLCSAGTASAVTGSGPWQWSCGGQYGGTTASCSARKLIPVMINDGALYTTSTAVTVILAAPKGLGFVRLSNNGIKWSKWRAVTPASPWKLSSGDGLKTVTAQFASSNTSTSGENYSDTINLDTKAPAGTVKVNGGKLFTNNSVVQITTTLKVPDTADTVDGICIGTSAACTNFTSFASSKNFTLSSGDGKKTVFIVLKDKAGKISKPLKATITLDTVAPVGTLLINGGKPITITTAVALKLVAKGASEMQLSSDGGVNWDAWQKFAGSRKVTLPGGNGMKMVKVRFRDLAGNVSADCEDSIELQGQAWSLLDSQRHFPLHYGNLWVSRVTELANGTVMRQYTNISRMAGTKVVGTVNTLVMAETEINSNNVLESYLGIDASGISFYGDNDSSDPLTAAVVPYKVVNFPIKPGSSFEQINKTGIDYGEDLDGDGKNEKIKIISTVFVRNLETVSTGAGTFPNCLRIETHIDETLTLSRNGARYKASGVETTWYAQDVGPVKQTTSISGDVESIQTTEEITGFMVDGHANGLSMEVNTTNAILNNGERLQLSVTLLDSANTSLMTVPAVWTSSNSAIASVDANGMVTGNGIGTATLTPSIGGVAGLPVTITVLVGFEGGDKYPGPSSVYGFGDTTIGDLNGDGRNDVAVLEVMSPRIFVYLQNASGTLNQPLVITTDLIFYRYNLTGIAIKDVTNDGFADLVVSGTSTTATTGWLGRVAVFKQDPVTHTLGPPQEYVLSTNDAGPLSVVDLDGDGLPDVVVACPLHAGDGVLSFLFQGTNGAFGPEIAYTAALADYNEVHVADLNDDGLNDLVVQSGPLQLAVIKQVTPGVFSPTPDFYSIQSPMYIQAFAAGDLNGDGRTDIAVVDAYDGIHIFQQNVAGTFSSSHLSYLQASELKIFDLDSDGLNDIILLNGGYVVTVLTQSAAHTFPNIQTFVLHTDGFGGTTIRQAMSVGDVTGDGLPDIVASWGEAVYVLERR